MRPVNRGPAPRTYTNYKHAAHDLYDHIGDFCSYCERQIETHLAVEHINPKSRRPGQINSWTNFLLACVNCNSVKGKKRITLKSFLWPDKDNTLLAIIYSNGGLVDVNTALLPGIQTLARNTIELTGLDYEPGNPNQQRRPTPNDRRWLRRNQVWQLANSSWQRLMNNDSIELREQIVETAVSRGLFSIWWTVFNGDQDMIRRLRVAFTGTAQTCFDPNENLITRAGGQT